MVGFFKDLNLGKRFKKYFVYILKDDFLLSSLAAEIGHFLQYLFFFLNFPQHFALTFFDEHGVSQPEQADLRANSVIEILEAIMFDLSTPQYGQTIHVGCRRFPHSTQSSRPCIPVCNLGNPKKF